MKPFLFPFTYIGTPDRAICTRFFEGFKVFQFSTKHLPPEIQTPLDAGLVEFVLPEPSACLSFETALAETERWAQSHRQGAASYAKGYRDRIPFFEASSVSQIRQDIRRADQQARSADIHDNETMTASIFLHLAQAFDIQNQTIAKQMQRQASMEKSLYEKLRGDASLRSLDRIEDFDDPAQFMLLDRLKAWARVWMSSGNPQGPFVTTRQAVISTIQEHLAENEDLVSAARVPAIDTESETALEQHQALWSYCQELAHTDLARIKESGLLDAYRPSAAAPDCIQIYLLPELKPDQLFSRFAGQNDSIETSTPEGADALNTVIGLIEP